MQDKHPSGLSWYKWNWPPARTPEDNKLLARYLKEVEKKAVEQQKLNFEPALF